MITISSRFLNGPLSLTNGLQAHWPFSSSLNTIDATGNGHAWSSGAIYGYNYEGYHGLWASNAVYFDLVGNYNLSPFGFTMAWYRYQTAWPGSGSVDFCGFQSGNYGAGFGYTYVSQTWFAVGDGTSRFYSPIYSNPQGPLCVGTYDGQYIRFYNNGGQVGSGTAYTGGIAWDPASRLTIQLFSQGSTDMLSVWNRALTSAEVSALYGSGWPYNTYQRFSEPALLGPLPLIRP